MARPWLRLVLAISLDGRLAPPQGGAAQLGGVGDRRRLEEALAWADGVLLGAQTLRLHRTSCLIHAPDLLEDRRRRGLPPQPTVVVWSRAGEVSADLPFFRQPFERWLLMAASAARLAPEVDRGFHRILPFEGWGAALELLAGQGLHRIAVLGGAQLAAALLEARVLDELQLTLCPMLLGGSHGWLPPEAVGDTSFPWVLAEQSVLEGGELLLHYVRAPQG